MASLTAIEPKITNHNSGKCFYGIGFNSKGKHKTKVNYNITQAYKAWEGMIRRCYCLKYQEKYPTYIGCSVDERWHDFQDFAEWYYSHPYSNIGYQLDKDILVVGNKIYSPETCCFVPKQLNSLLVACDARRGEYPQGVTFCKQTGRYRSQISIDRVSVGLGRFDCPQKAHLVYKKAKEIHIRNKALEWRDRISSDAFNALMSWKLET